MDVIVKAVEGNALYHRYPRVQGPQPCYVELNCKAAELSASYSTEIERGMPMSVWHGLRRRYRIVPLKSEAANALLAELVPLASRVCDGFVQCWDGHNTVGRLNADATEAEEEIQRICRDRDFTDAKLAVWSASEHFGVLGSKLVQAAELGITAETTDELLADIATRELEQADDNGVDDIEGIDAYLESLREAVRAESTKSEDDDDAA